MHNHVRPTRITALTFLIMALTTLALTLSIPLRRPRHHRQRR